METLFKKLNENATVAMYAGLIEDFISEDTKSYIPVIYGYYLDVKNIDKNNLSDKNLAQLEALQFFFKKFDIPFKEKSNTYKKYFLKLLTKLYQHQLLYGFNDNNRVNISLDLEKNCVEYDFTHEKVCDRKYQDLAIQNINNLKDVELESLDEILTEYEKQPWLLDWQVAFVLKSYLNEIVVSDSYHEELLNWKNQMVVFGKSENQLFEKTYFYLDQIVRDYMDSLFTKRVRADLGRDDVIVHSVLDYDNKVVFVISKQYNKQKKKNM